MLLIYYVISLYNSIMESTYMCFLKNLNENQPRLALILRLTAIVGGPGAADPVVLLTDALNLGLVGGSGGILPRENLISRTSEMRFPAF